MQSHVEPSRDCQRDPHRNAPFRWWCFAILGTFAVVLVSPANADELTGRDVIRRMEAVRARGDGAAKRYLFTMVDRAGGTTTRTVTTYRKRCGATVRDLVLIHDPPDVAGSAVLTHTHPDRAPDMWLYLPELGRVRQLNAFAQGDSFLGSDVSYSDLAPIPVDLRTHRLLRHAPLDDGEVHVVESTPTLPERYSRIVTWVSKQFFLPVRVFYYDREGTLLKTGEVADIRHVQGIPTTALLSVTNHHRQHRTDVKLLDVEYDAPRPCSQLTKRHLRRIR